MPHIKYLLEFTLQEIITKRFLARFVKYIYGQNNGNKSFRDIESLKLLVIAEAIPLVNKLLAEAVELEDIKMSITVNLWSKKPGAIRMFLERYYGREVYLDDDVEEWIYVYNKPLDAIDIISAIMDNDIQNHISVCIKVNDGDLHPITVENHNDIIKGIFDLFYEEKYELIS